VSSEQRTSSGVNLKTLLIAAAASATAAFIVPMIWKPGTVFAAAMTPVIVAIVSELLKRPVDTVSAVAVRRTPGGAAILEPPQRKQEEPGGAAILEPPPPSPDETFDPLAPPPTEELEALPDESAAPRAEHRRRPLTARQWKLALATGLIAFAAVVVFFTASELVTGNQVSTGGARTTFFGGSSSKKSDTDKQDSESKKDKNKSDETSPTPTPSATESPEPSTSPTPTASATQTPAPSVAPNAASPQASAAPTP
jgi:hypothetical protein